MRGSEDRAKPPSTEPPLYSTNCPHPQYTQPVVHRDAFMRGSEDRAKPPSTEPPLYSTNCPHPQYTQPVVHRDAFMRGSEDRAKPPTTEPALHLNNFTERIPIYNRAINSAMTVKKVSSLDSQTDLDPCDVIRPSKSGPVTPVGMAQGGQGIPKSAVFLPGDRVQLTENVTLPGTHTVYRNADERAANPDRLNLDRRRLLFCPILEGEDNLRLLNYQHNLISKIENVSNLRRLIFLDLYDNDIQEISNLDHLKSLRVLMLGKNRITKIENLKALTKLDVLDLHGNRISVIENLSHLSELRVLNLAGNVITKVGDLVGMNSLTELNLRRNKIRNVTEIDMLSCLQRLFLSFNDISSFEDMHCVFDCASLTELAIDGNPLAQLQQYKFNILKRAPHILQLDMKRITDDERRNALTLARKEEEKKREFTKMTVMKEKRRQAISNAKRQWEVMQSKVLSHSGKVAMSRSNNDTQAQYISTHASNSRDSDSSHSEKPSRGNSSRLGYREAEEARPPSAKPKFKETMTFHAAEDEKQHLAELEGDTLSLYGQAALEAFERNWGVQAAGTITTVVFRFMDFDDVTKHLHKLRIRFPAVHSLVFSSTNMHSLRQLNGLTSVRHLDHLTIQEEGNPMTSLSLWRLYAIYRLSAYNLKTINDVEVSEDDVKTAEAIFGDLATEAINLPDTTLHCLLTEQQRRTYLGLDEPIGKEKKGGSVRKRNGKASLVYNIPGEEVKSEVERISRQDATTKMIADAKLDAIYADKKRLELETQWPQIFYDMVVNAVTDMADLKQYMKQCIDHIDKG